MSTTNDTTTTTTARRVDQLLAELGLAQVEPQRRTELLLHADGRLSRVTIDEAAAACRPAPAPALPPTAEAKWAGPEW